MCLVGCSSAYTHGYEDASAEGVAPDVQQGEETATCVPGGMMLNCAVVCEDGVGHLVCPDDSAASGVGADFGHATGCPHAPCRQPSVR